MENTEPIDHVEEPDFTQEKASEQEPPVDLEQGEDASKESFGSDLSDMELEEDHPADMAELVHKLQRKEGRCEYLSVGTPVFLEVRLMDKVQKIPSRIVGWQQGRYILVENPLRNRNLLSELKKKNAKAIVRYLHNGTAIGFKTRVQHLASVPQMLLNLQFPYEFESVPVRHNHRMEIALPCTLVTEDRKLEGFLRDLSLDGARVITENEIRSGTQVGVSFTVPNGKKMVEVKAEVKNKFPLQGGWVLGLYFVETDENIKEVYRFLEKMLRGSLPQ